MLNLSYIVEYIHTCRWEIISKAVHAVYRIIQQRTFMEYINGHHTK